LIEEGKEDDNLCMLLETFIIQVLNRRVDEQLVINKLKKGCCSELLTPDLLDLMLARAQLR